MLLWHDGDRVLSAKWMKPWTCSLRVSKRRPLTWKGEGPSTIHINSMHNC